MGKNKKSFRSQWQTLTELGTQYGISARKFGSLLKEHGLREQSSGIPTPLAEGMYQEITPKNGKPYILWGRTQVIDYLKSKGINPIVSNKEAIKDTEARKLARNYLEAQKLGEEGSKLGYLMFQEMSGEIRKIGLERFNKALKAIGYKGEEVTLDEE
ncbi:MAG: hypothetical protein F6K36_13370 [Symploca sp. SIO3C6]|uniref:Uncharacterized protein n=1 Tax=Symploca sp. SIO1C4 TaxID=2607765 RepID=A0A6B3NJ92_9CYAN|nr:hypothetical protein [Symploca sp. SIO3C6]NER31823.1 hypothetical protein [Symploca sp. SIO1C4]NET06991.1 hypothetical protein [Symploca sp. SIO2B6]NET50670.1 hypothetical protein [Merismopedia sp. SIO2A8]